MTFFRQFQKPPGTRGFEVGFRFLPVFKKSGRGRSRVGKKPARKPVFTVFGYPGISLRVLLAFDTTTKKMAASQKVNKFAKLYKWFSRIKQSFCALLSSK